MGTKERPRLFQSGYVGADKTVILSDGVMAGQNKRLTRQNIFVYCPKGIDEILYNKTGIEKENLYGNQSSSIFFGCCKGREHYKGSRGFTYHSADFKPAVIPTGRGSRCQAV